MSEVEELNDGNFQEALARQSKTIVDVFASWCGPCRLFSPIFKKVSEDYKDIGFYKIDGDAHPNSRNDLTIDNLPYVAFFKDGKFVKGTSTSTEQGLIEFLKSVI